MAFSSSRTVYNFLTKLLGIKIALNDVREFERKYVLSNEIIRNRKSRGLKQPYFAYGLNEQ